MEETDRRMNVLEAWGMNRERLGNMEQERQERKEQRHCICNIKRENKIKRT